MTHSRLPTFLLRTGFITLFSRLTRVGLLVGCGVFFLLFAARLLRAADETTISAGALAQIGALIAEKEARTPAQRKIDSQLLYAAKMARGAAVAPGVAKLDTGVTVDAAGLVEIEIRAKVSGELQTLIKRLGGKILGQYPFADSTIAQMPINRLEELAEDSSVVFVKRPAQANLNRANVPGPAPTAGTSTLTPRQKRFRDNLLTALSRLGPLGPLLMGDPARTPAVKSHRVMQRTAR